MRLCGCSNGKWLVQLEVILVTCALCWSAPENCRREIPHGAMRSVEMTLPFCPHAGKPKVIATSLINETPKGDWGFFFYFLHVFFQVSTGFEWDSAYYWNAEGNFQSVCLWNNALTLLRSLVLNSLVNLLLQTDPFAKANTFPGQYQIPSGSSHGWDTAPRGSGT